MIAWVMVGATLVRLPSGLSALNGGWFAMPTVAFFAACKRANTRPPESLSAVAPSPANTRRRGAAVIAQVPRLSRHSL
jgi:hypothetical protein